jgi:hypothetical protein
VIQDLYREHQSKCKSLKEGSIARAAALTRRENFIAQGQPRSTTRAGREKHLKQEKRRRVAFDID